MVDKKVDVIIPVWRTLKYLPDLFNSITEIDDIHYSFLVDYSDEDQQDAEWNYIESRGKELGLYFSNTKALRNLGLAGARNHGITVGSAPYIIWMDSDDVFYPGCIQQRVEFMEAHPELDFAYGTYFTFRGKFKPTEPPYSIYGDPADEDDICRRRYSFEEIFEKNRFSTCAGIIKRSSFIPFDESVRVAEDYAWVLDHFLDWKYDFIPDCPCFYYRLRPDSLSTDREAQKLHYDFIIKRKRKVRRKIKEKQNAG